MNDRPQDAARRTARTGGRRERWIAATLVFSVAVVAFWEIMANRSRRPYEVFQVTAADFAGFMPAGDGWEVRVLPVQNTRIEPNILAYEVRARSPASEISGPVLVRLVHGYNMPDCMRIKRYRVDLVKDTRAVGAQRRCERPLQIWRLTSATGDKSVWVTGMLRAGDFRESDVDVCAMAFPRIGTPDDPSWLPEGLKLSSFKHPVRNFRWLLRAKWNNARCDLATFLKLRQPAWASDELLTLVGGSDEGALRRTNEAAVTEAVLRAHEFVYRQLRAWRERVGGAK